MRPYSRKDIENIYADIIKSAKKNYAKKQLRDALDDIITAADWAYRFNHIYTDPEAEELVKSIAEETVKTVEIGSPNGNRCVLIDSFLLDNRGLSQQYLRAMMAYGMDILVIYTNAGGKIGKDILKEIQGYDKASILYFNKDTDYFEQTRQAVERIVELSPAHIFLHLTPWDVVALMTCYVVKGSKIYNINLTDHAYWMGASFIDFNLEFRPYGMTVSLEKRALRPEQLINLPYYPISPISTILDGMPKLPDDAIKILTGGSLYKMLGKNGIFFQIINRILNISPNIYFLVAGFDKDSRFDAGISSISGKERVLQIGIRKDIDAVFDNCDIYMGTYPTGGGLMSQYAAKHGKPIIAYHDKGDVVNAVEEVVNCYQHEFRSFDNFEELATYVSMLVNDKDYRLSQGKLLQQGLMDEEHFNKEFGAVISAAHTTFVWEKDNIDYDKFFERYIELENANGNMATLSLIRKQKIKALIKVKNNKSQMISGMFEIIKNVPSHLSRRIIRR